MGYFYGVLYSFFKVFPLVYPVMYGFDLGQTGLAFLCCLVSTIIAVLAYFAYLRHDMSTQKSINGSHSPEHRIVPALLGSVFMTVGLFIFAWNADSMFRSALAFAGVTFARPLYVNWESTEV